MECSALTQDGVKDLFIESIRIALKSKGVKRKEGKSSGEGSTCQTCQLIWNWYKYRSSLFIPLFFKYTRFSRQFFVQNKFL